jgi:hypothetical protein
LKVRFRVAARRRGPLPEGLDHAGTSVSCSLPEPFPLPLLVKNSIFSEVRADRKEAEALFPFRFRFPSGTKGAVFRIRMEEARAPETDAEAL